MSARARVSVCVFECGRASCAFSVPTKGAHTCLLTKSVFVCMVMIAILYPTIKLNRQNTHTQSKPHKMEWGRRGNIQKQSERGCGSQTGGSQAQRRDERIYEYTTVETTATQRRRRENEAHGRKLDLDVTFGIALLFRIGMTAGCCCCDKRCCNGNGVKVATDDGDSKINAFVWILEMQCNVNWNYAPPTHNEKRTPPNPPPNISSSDYSRTGESYFGHNGIHQRVYIYETYLLLP